MHQKLDMTQGPILRLVVLFALPIIGSNILQQLYTTVDTLIIGNFCGTLSIAAVGTSSQPVEIFLGVFMGIGSGVTILISRYTGSRDVRSVTNVVRASGTLTWIISIPTAVLGVLLVPSLFRLMQVPDSTFSLAVIYASIIFIGLPGNMGYNMNAGILRGLGDSGATFYFLLVSSVTNVILDIVFVAGLGLDVGGAAAATTISMYAAWAATILYIHRKYPDIGFQVLPCRPDKKAVRSILAYGLPLGLNNSLYSIGHVALQSAVNLQGADFMAGASIAGKISSLIGITLNSFSSAMSTFTGQNAGADNPERIVRGARSIILVSSAVTISISAVLYFLSGPLAGLFTDDATVTHWAVLCLHLQLPFHWCYGVLNCIINLANGLGRVKFSTFISLFMLWAVRIPVSWMIALFGDGHYVSAGVSISFVAGMFVALLFFRSRTWKSIQARAKGSVLEESR
ncbi:MAG: MATE family efflux transporter [Lachnospiraceae bacterium]|jgi:putative MATE family efflux protein